MTKEEVTKLQRAVTAFLINYLVDNNLSATIVKNNVTYGDANVRLSLALRMTDADSAKKNFDRYAELVNLTPDHFGTEVFMGDRLFKVAGLDMRKRDKTVILKALSDEDPNKIYLTTPENLLKAIRAKNAARKTS